ncbi:hypothetical protein ScPMuIL_015047 [Solemya velum]
MDGILGENKRHDLTGKFSKLRSSHSAYLEQYVPRYCSKLGTVWRLNTTYVVRAIDPVFAHIIVIHVWLVDASQNCYATSIICLYKTPMQSSLRRRNTQVVSLTPHTPKGEKEEICPCGYVRLYIVKLKANSVQKVLFTGTTTINCKALIDLIVVVDGSDSITASDFQTLRQALVKMIGEVHIGPDDARMGIVVYSTDIGAQVNVSGNPVALQQQTLRLPHPRDGTNTSLGIKTMTEMFLTQGRPNVPTVGIVITDGISKNPDETAREAAIARALGINMFAVGVTNLIDMNELQSIASSDNQVLSVANFNELAKSMGSLVMLVCPTTTTTTTTTTKPPTTTTSTQRPTTTTTTVPPTTVPYVPTVTHPHQPADPINGLCNSCRVINGVGYNSHPDSCDKYVQCHFGQGGEGGAIRAIYRQCPFGTFWKQDILSCVASNKAVCPNDPCQNPSLVTYPYDIVSRRAFWECYNGKSVAMCCPLGQSYRPYIGCQIDPTSNDSCPPQSENPTCDRRAVPVSPTHFEQNMPGFGWVRMPCAPGTKFNPKDCNCTLHVSYNVERVCKPELHIPFDKDCQDHSGRNVYVRNENVIVQNGVGFFNGHSRLLIPRFSNFNSQSDIVIKLRYKEAPGYMYGSTKNGVGIESLITNGDCGSPATLIIAKSQNHLHFGLRTAIGNVASFTIGKPNTEWKNVTLIHDRNTLEGRVNSIAEVESNIGQLQDTSCDLQVGHGDHFNNFIGYIDELRRDLHVFNDVRTGSVDVRSGNMNTNFALNNQATVKKNTNLRKC